MFYRKYVCDNDIDCIDASDEKNCQCLDNEFRCDNGLCIMKDWTCDGINDCIDNSDERPSNCKGRCNGRSFKCNNKKCIRKNMICNGHDDCGDSSDEAKSACLKCPYNSFECAAEGMCILNKTRCDKKFDCKDGSDEIGCPKTACGYGTCSQICVEKKATHFNCKCVSGYGKGHGKNDTCTVLDSKQKLLIAGETGLKFMHPYRNHEGSFDIKLFGSGILKIKAFDYLIKNNGDTIIFWIDYNTKRLQRVTLKEDNKSKDDIKRFRRESISAQDVLTIVDDLKDPIALAVDYLSEKLYVMDANSEAIIVMDLNGQSRTTIVYTGRYPTEIILDLQNRNLIWTTKLKAILYASMDGAEKKTLVSHDIEWASGLTIDYPTGRLYWVDQRKSTIETSLLNGSDVHYVKVLDELAKPQKIDVFEDYLYVTLRNQSIFKVNKFGHGPIEHLLDSNHRAYSIAMVHPLKQYPDASNPCSTNACDQSSVCLLSSANGSRRTCTCPDSLHKTVRDGKVVCEEKTQIPGLCNLRCIQGTCRFVNDKPKCFCHPEFDGELCDHYICSDYCKNGGKCYILYKSNNQTERKCNCVPGYSGEQCELPIDLCKSECHNGGTCIWASHGIENCICSSEFTGDKCQDCKDLVCINGGVCRKNANGASICLCQDG